MKAAIFSSMPEPDGHDEFPPAETPRLRVNFGVGHETIRASAPGLPLAFEAGFERRDIAHHGGVAGCRNFSKVGRKRIGNLTDKNGRAT